MVNSNGEKPCRTNRKVKWGQQQFNYTYLFFFICTIDPNQMQFSLSHSCSPFVSIEFSILFDEYGLNFFSVDFHTCLSFFLLDFFARVC